MRDILVLTAGLRVLREELLEGCKDQHVYQSFLFVELAFQLDLFPQGLDCLLVLFDFPEPLLILFVKNA
jgi:hypothetical protein